MEYPPASSIIQSTLHNILSHIQHLPTLPTLPTKETLTHARSSLPATLPSTHTTHIDWRNHILDTLPPALPRSSLSPTYYGFVTGGSTPPALAADILVSILDQNVQVHLPQQSIATEVEVCALGMLADLLGLERVVWGGGMGKNGGGGVATFTTGATASNVLGLGMGREFVLAKKVEERGGVSSMSVGERGLYDVMQTARVRTVKVLSSMPHSSIGKAAAVVGLGRGNVVSVGKEGGLGIDFEVLEREISKADVACILVISAGEVNTGRFATSGYEEMKRIRELCDKYDVWIHVDGAFGLFGRILPSDTGDTEFAEVSRACQGLELADSITGDAHKLLNVPYDCGFYFCRHKAIAEEVFRNGSAAYLSSSAGSEDRIPSPLNIGIENSRRFRALPVYATLLAYGREGYIDMLKRQIRLARKVVSELWDSEVYQLLPEARSMAEMVEKTFIVVLFRARDEELNSELVRRINATTRIYVSGTVWDGKPAARIAVANWNVDVERDYKVIQGVLEEIAK